MNIKFSKLFFIIPLLLLISKPTVSQWVFDYQFNNPDVKCINVFPSQDTNTYPTLLSLGVGAYTYKFVNLYFYEVNILSYIGQRMYLETGLILYRERYIDNKESTINYLCLNLYFIHRWDINKKIFMYGGIGFSYSPAGAFVPNLLLRNDIKLSESINLGMEIKQCLIVGKNASKYLKFPAVSVNLTLIL